MSETPRPVSAVISIFRIGSGWSDITVVVSKDGGSGRHRRWPTGSSGGDAGRWSTKVMVAAAVGGWWWQLSLKWWITAIVAVCAAPLPQSEENLSKVTDKIWQNRWRMHCTIPIRYVKCQPSVRLVLTGHCYEFNERHVGIQRVKIHLLSSEASLATAPKNNQGRCHTVIMPFQGGGFIPQLSCQERDAYYFVALSKACKTHHIVTHRECLCPASPV